MHKHGNVQLYKQANSRLPLLLLNDTKEDSAPDSQTTLDELLSLHLQLRSGKGKHLIPKQFFGDFILQSLLQLFHLKDKNSNYPHYLSTFLKSQYYFLKGYL